MNLDEIQARIEKIEDAYEFFLAYAAQGLSGDAIGKSGEQARSYLTQFCEALEGLTDGFREQIEGAADRHAPALTVLERDEKASLALARLLLDQPAISSQMVDNLNASIHIRALLTDLFLLGDVAG